MSTSLTEWIPIGRIARQLRCCSRTLLRLEDAGLVQFARIGGVRHLQPHDVGDVPAFTLGRAAELLGVSYERLRRLAAAGRIDCVDLDGCRRRVTLRTIRRLQNEFGTRRAASRSNSRNLSPV